METAPATGSWAGSVVVPIHWRKGSVRERSWEDSLMRGSSRAPVREGSWVGWRRLGFVLVRKSLTRREGTVEFVVQWEMTLKSPFAP